MMKMSLFWYLLASVLVARVAYAEPTHTVDWYQQHTTERQVLLKECRSNPGELGNTPNCINAEKAENLHEGSKTGGLFPPGTKPLTSKDLPPPWGTKGVK